MAAERPTTPAPTAATTTWYRISLSPRLVAAGHIDRIEDALAAVLADRGTPAGAALFGMTRDDGGVDLYFTPAAARIASDLLKRNGAVASLPPVNDGDVTLLVGDRHDRRLLCS